MKTVSIVVPVYNNKGSLPPLFEEFKGLETELAQLDVALQLIFVDDGSKDDSFSELKKIKLQRPETTIVKLTRNFGSVSTSKTGLKFATGDCFIWIAADLQDPPELIIDMIKHWLDGEKYIIAIRKERDDPFLSKVFSAIYYWILKRFIIPDYPYGGFDLALMDKQLLSYIRDSSKNINTPLLSYWLGFQPVILEYHRRKRIHGKSQWSFAKRIKFFVDSLYGFSAFPLRLITMIGFIVSALSFLYGGSVVVNTLIGVSPSPGFPTIVALITFLLGLIIIMLGIIGEYIWRIFDQLNQRPEAVIDEVL